MSGLSVQNKNNLIMDQDIISKIENILAQLRPLILKDGGDIKLVSFHEGKVAVKLYGACIGCPMSIFTLKIGIEEKLKESIPQVIEVIAI